MNDTPNIAQIASLIGDPARARMLMALMNGMALTARELAEEAGVTPQTASGHLGKMQGAGLLAQAKQGRHRYFRLAGEQVAQALEALLVLAEPMRVRPGPRDDKLRRARLCYNHLAGDYAVLLYDRLVGCDGLGPQNATLSVKGAEFLHKFFGFEPAQLPAGRGPDCLSCLDWSNRRAHLGGRVGRGLLAHLITRGWVRRVESSRALLLSPPAEACFAQLERGG